MTLLLRVNGGIFAVVLMLCSVGLGSLRRADSTALQLAFIADQYGVAQIYLSDFYGRNLHPLTDGEGQDFYPVWSPTNNYVAFSSYRGQGATIYLITPAGGRLTEIGLAIGSAINPTWSPSGEYLVFERFTQRGDRNLLGYDVATGRLRQLTPDTTRDWYPMWSAADDTLFYLSDRDGSVALMRYNIRTATATPLFAYQYGDGYPTISPEGRWVAFGRAGAIYRLDTVTGDETLLVDTADADGNPYWSPDGRWIAFTSYDTTDAATLYRMNPDGGDLLALDHGEGDIYTVGPLEWSSDSRWIAYSAFEAGLNRSAIYRVGVNGNQHARLTRLDYNSNSPTWSPTIDAPFHAGWLALIGIGAIIGVNVLTRRF